MFRVLFATLFLMSASLYSADSAENVLNLAKKRHCEDRCSSSSHEESDKTCCRGPRGPQGANGQNGHNGARGPTGPTGPVGPTGVNAPGFVIPFASGREFSSLSTDINGDPELGVMVSFGDSRGITIDFSGINPSFIGNFAYVMPRDGTLTSIAAAVNLFPVPVFLDGTVIVFAQIWTADPGSNTFFPLSDALVTLDPSLSGLVFASNLNGLSDGLSIPLSAQTKVMMVFYASASGDEPDLTNNFIADYSAGICIE